MSTLLRKTHGWLVFSFLWGYMGAQAAELNVTQPYEHGRWNLEGDAFECRLSQQLNGMARVSFVRQPGFPVLLQLQLLNTEETFNSAKVRLRKADWQPDSQSFAGQFTERGQINNFNAIFSQEAGKLLSMLQHGYWLDFELDIGGTSVQLTLANIQAKQALEEYEQCKAMMSPLTWEQARQYEVHFAPAQQVVESPKVLDYLRNMVRYIELDEQISKVLIDGHTDDVGNSAANRALSQARADEVASRMVEFGLKPEMIEIRAHGSRYPIVSNTSDAKRLNRRVTIRLIKQSEQQGE